MSKKPGLTVDEKQKIKSLIAIGKSFNAVAEEIGRDPKTVKKYASAPETALEILGMKRELADSYEDLNKRMIASITDEDIKKINAYQRTVSAGICTDKIKLLRGEFNGTKPLVIVNRISIRDTRETIDAVQITEVKETPKLIE